MLNKLELIRADRIRSKSHKVSNFFKFRSIEPYEIFLVRFKVYPDEGLNSCRVAGEFRRGQKKRLDVTQFKQ